MSAERKKSGNDGYIPNKPPPKETPATDQGAPKEPMMTASQYQSQQLFFREQVQSFKELFEDSMLAKWIIMAGISGLVVAVLELARIIWLVIRYEGKF
jgi:hypothetical protein